MPDLKPGEVHLWLARYDRVDDPQANDAWRAVLIEEERAQARRFHFEDDRRRYLVTRALVRTVLSRYADVAPGDWRFSSNAYGRPSIAEAHPDAGDLSFNISHTRHLIALALTRGAMLGVDVENFVARQAPIDVANHFFSPSEVAALLALDRTRRQRRFFEYWTLKESYIKARGMGLSLPLDKFAFDYPCERTVTLDIHPELDDDPGRWHLWQMQPAPEYLLALCIEKQAGITPRLVLQPPPFRLPDIDAADLRMLRTSA
jgi:4'-phosphopantetheinyl transferase